MTSLIDLISPEEAQKYLATKVFMDFDATSENTIQKPLDVFRDEQLIPSLVSMACERMPELIDDAQKCGQVGQDLWRNLMVNAVMGDCMPDANDPARDIKALNSMNDVVVQLLDAMVSEDQIVAQSTL